MVYNLDDFKKFKPDCETYAVFGNPVGHSLSPQLHEEFFKLSKLNCNYIKIEVSEEEFPAVMDLAREKLCGFNCTIPFKNTVIPFLDHADERVRILSACNTVAVRDGKLHGYNTDGIGFIKAMEFSGVSLKDKKVLLLGAGGAATSIAYEAALIGAEITCAGRKPERVLAFANKISRAAGAGCVKAESIDSVSGSFNIIINATPVGMHPNVGVSSVNINNFTDVEFVYDCIYNPLMTMLLYDAQCKDIKYDNGLSMLVLQGAASQAYWNGLEFSNEILTELIDKLEVSFAKSRLNDVRKRTNIALSGFMGCGKTTIGKQLAERMGMQFIDLDEKIEQEQRMTISDIFEKYGEFYFRDLETAAAKECAKLSNTVISTGGGTVLRTGNSDILKETSFLIFIDRPLSQIEENLSNSENRPLLNTPKIHDHILSLFEYRYPQYIKNCDTTVFFNKNLPDASKLIIRNI